MLPSAVNDTMRDMMAQIRDVGDGIRGGTYTMTAPVITGGSINGTTIGATTASTGKFTAVTNSALTSGRVTYAGTSGVLQDDADFTFNGTTVTMANDASISGLTVGKGGGSVSGNTVVGGAALGANTTGSINTAVGYASLYTNTSGTNNSANGYYALFSNTTGSFNTAVGNAALFSSTTAAQNTAVGREAGYANTTGQYLAFLGHAAGRNNTTGSNNTAVGEQSLFSNTTASDNTAVGYQAGYSNTTGTENTAVGAVSLFSNSTGSYNSAYGRGALNQNSTGTNNTAIGHNALVFNTTASNNTAVGYQALYSGTTAQRSVAVGKTAGYAITTGSFNTFLGEEAGLAATTSSGNTFIGQGSGQSITTGGSNSILGRYSGNQGGLDIRTASNYIVLSDGDGNIRQFTNASGFTKITDSGASPVLSVTGTFHEIVSTAAGSPGLIAVSTNASYTDKCFQVDAARDTSNGTFQAIGYYNRGANAWRMYVQDSGNLQNTNNSYGAISDIKLKENIVDASPKLEDLCKVKVRTYNFKADQTHKQIGVVAQELEEVFPGLVEQFNDKDGDGNDLGTTTKAVKYSVFVPMLIKAVQELNAKVEAQALEIATLKGK
jgi:hypothetical protein